MYLLQAYIGVPTHNYKTVNLESLQNDIRETLSDRLVSIMLA